MNGTKKSSILHLEVVDYRHKLFILHKWCGNHQKELVLEGRQIGTARSKKGWDKKKTIYLLFIAD
jgi:hypothetical protein